MKLIKAQVTNFRSVEDSGEIEFGDLTCLVGKNEAGKTAVLSALYGLKPFRDFDFDKTRDYPRRFLSKFDERNPNGSSRVIKTWWSLDADDISVLSDRFVEGVVADNVIRVERGIGYSNPQWTVNVNEKKVIGDLIIRHKLNADDKKAVSNLKTTEKIAEVLENIEGISEKQTTLLEEIKSYRKNRVLLSVIDVLSERMPKFFFTSHYERMSGEISIDQITANKEAGTLTKGDEIFLDFLEYAGTTIEELQSASKFEDLKAQCEGASNDITDEIFEFWSQNDALQVQIELGEGRSDDPAPLDSGTIAKIRIYNQHHRASVPLSERSSGFVWFFSFLAQFKRLQSEAGNAIILLDEPGLTLHGKAQSDLLRYIEERLLGDHQVIFTTHSPFMIPADRLSDVRVVEDLVEYGERGRPTVHGTKVSSDVLSVDKDTLFPLQAHLGYEITQSLFIGKNTLLVEGPSDILFLQALSIALKNRSRVGLSSDWAICPTGGIDKIMPFASLFSGNNLNIAVLCDIAHGDKGKVQRLRESEILHSKKIFTYADFTGQSESDVEDVFHPELYSEIINGAYELAGENVVTPDKIIDVEIKTDRMVKRVESLFNLMPAEVPEFDHYKPSDYLLRNPSLLDGETQSVSETLDVAEKVFLQFNGLLS